jgi:hypothetical protein
MGGKKRERENEMGDDENIHRGLAKDVYNTDTRRGRKREYIVSHVLIEIGARERENKSETNIQLKVKEEKYCQDISR